MGLSQHRLAKQIDVPTQRISEIVAGKRSITADTDLRLCRFLACPKAIGCAPRLPMIWKLPNANSRQFSIKSSHGWNRRHESGLT
jgi:transcriptional regulator with XRE-family HTH domain